MTRDPIMDELMSAADAPDEDFHVATAAALLDNSAAPASQHRSYVPPQQVDDLEIPRVMRGRLPGEAPFPGLPLDDAARLHRAEAEMIEAWGVLVTTPGFVRVPGETLPQALRRTLSAANLKENEP